MKKILTFLLTALLAFGVGWATTASITFSDKYSSNTTLDGVTIAVDDNVSLVFNKAQGSTAPQYYASGTSVRMYAKNTMTVSSEYTINQIVITFGSSDGSNAITTNVGSYTSNSGTWTGSANTVIFTEGGSSGNRRIAAVTVTYTGGGTTVAIPVFSPAAGTYFGAQQVSMTCETEGASIYYTTDGTQPSSSNGALYTSAVTIGSSTTLKAIAVKDGFTASDVTEAYYNIIDGGSVFRKVKSTTDLVEGRKYILVYPGTLSNHSEIGVMGAITSDNYGTFVTDNDLTITSDNKIDVAGLNVAVLTLGGSAGSYTFKIDGTNYLSLTNNTDALYANTNPSSSNSQWSVNSNSAGTNYYLVNKYYTDRKVMANVNQDPKRFACYTGVGSYQTYALLFYQYNGSEPASLSVDSDSLLIGVSGDSFDVYGDNLTQNLTVAASSGFNASPGSIAADATFPATVTVTYTGQALGATGTVTVSNTSDNLSETVNVNYVYDGDIYIVGDINNTSWSFSNCTQMTRDGDVYKAYVTAQEGGEYEYIKRAWFYFTKSIGDQNTVVNNAFGPAGTGGRWWMNPEWYGDSLALDVNGNLNTIFMSPGSYLIQVYPAINKFSITPYVAEPVITPATGLYREAQNVTITCETDGATIYYTTDGNTPTTSSAVYSGEFTVSQTTTVKAIAVSNGMTSDVVESVITIKPLSNTYVLVTNTNDIVGDEDYVLVYSRSQNSTDYAMSNDYTPSYYSTVTDGFNLANGVVTLEQNSTVNILTLESTGVNNQYYIKDDAGNYLYYSSGNTVSRSSECGSYPYKWNLTIDNNGDVVINNEATVSRYLQCNWNNTRYACYQSNSNIPNAKLYKSGTPAASITVNPTSMELVIPAGGLSQSGTATVTEAYTAGTTDVTIDGDTDIFSAILDNGTLTVTYSGTATQANPDQATITLTNGTATATVTVTGYKLPMTVTITPADGHTFQGSTVTGIIESNVAGATIEYSFDGITWQTYNPNEGFTATVSNVGGTVTVYARATYDGETATTQVTYTRVAQTSTCTADIVFAPTSNGGNLSTWDGLKSHISEGADYVSDATVSTLITSTTYNAMRFGSSSFIGELDLTLDLTKFETGVCKLTKVTINAARYSNDTDCELKVSTNVNTTGVTLPITADQTAFTDYVFSFDGSEITTLTIANLAINKRVYVRSITLEYNCELSLTLADLVETGEENKLYTISNQLIAAAVTWDADKEKFAIFAKDNKMYADKSEPTGDMKEYLIKFVNQDSTFVNTVEQKDYDQSNWIEILIPSEVSNITSKSADPNAYQTKLDQLKETYENQILSAGTLKGTYVDAFNPTMSVVDNMMPEVETSSTYTPNIYCTANFLWENLGSDGATSYRDDQYGGQYFMMDAKPNEFCKVVWAYYQHMDDYFVAPAQEGDTINGHNFHGSFLADMSLCEDSWVVEKSPLNYFTASNATTPEKLFGFRAIVRKNPESPVWASKNGAPHRIQPSTESPKEQNPAYIVYPLNSETSSTENVTAVTEVTAGKAVVGVRYYNIMGVESDTPFEGINIMVTRYSDGSTTSCKVLR